MMAEERPLDALKEATLQMRQWARTQELILELEEFKGLAAHHREFGKGVITMALRAADILDQAIRIHHRTYEMIHGPQPAPRPKLTVISKTEESE